MQVRKVLVDSVFAITTVGAMSQEIDRSETLQAQSLAAQQAQANSTQSRTRQSVVAETRNLEAVGQLRVSELANAPTVDVVLSTAYASGVSRADVRKELAQWRQTHKLVVGDLG